MADVDPSDIPRIMTIPEAARILRCSEDTVRRYCRKGTLRARKFAGGSKWMVSGKQVADLLRYFEEGGEDDDWTAG